MNQRRRRLFDDFLAVPALAKDVHTRDFTSLVKSLGNYNSSGLRYVLVLAESPSLCDFLAWDVVSGAHSAVYLGNDSPQPS